MSGSGCSTASTAAATPQPAAAAWVSRSCGRSLGCTEARVTLSEVDAGSGAQALATFPAARPAQAPDQQP